MIEEKFSPEITPEPESVIEPVSAPEIPPKPTGNRSKIILLSVLGLILVGSLVFAGQEFVKKQFQSGAQPTPTPVAVATPTPNPTAEWKTYTNIKYGYSVGYPEEWKVEVDASVRDFPKIYVAQEEIRFNGQPPGSPEDDTGGSIDIEVNVYNNPSQLSFLEWLEEAAYEPEVPFLGVNVPIPQQSNLSVGGIPAYGVRIPADAERLVSDFLKTFVARENKVYKIETYTDLPNYPSEFEDVYNLFLTTFRFLEESEKTEGDPKEKCTISVQNGIKRGSCATCGNGICESYESCVIPPLCMDIASYTECEKSRILSPCGELYCPQDCGIPHADFY